MKKIYTIAELAERIGAKVQGDASCQIQGLAPLSHAKPGQLSFLVRSQYRKFLATTEASAIVLNEKDAKDCPVTALISPNPELAFARVAELFATEVKSTAGIHPTAVIADSAQIDATAMIGANVVVKDNVAIGANTCVDAGSIIGVNTTIGADCIIHGNVSIYYDITIGDRVKIDSGVVIGAEGFGFAQDNGTWIRIPQLGGVTIGNDVEIGANTTIDRGALQDTIVEDGVKLDNQVVIGHNVRIGAHTVIAGASAVAGSTHIGRYCMIGGGVCINDHITIADGVIITGMSMVTKSLERGVYSSGTSIQTNQQWHRSVLRFHQLDDIAKRVRKLEGLCNELNEQ